MPLIPYRKASNVCTEIDSERLNSILRESDCIQLEDYQLDGLSAYVTENLTNDGFGSGVILYIDRISLKEFASCQKQPTKKGRKVK